MCIVLCIISFFRSSNYDFLGDNKILPLPCINSIRNHLLAVKIGCGFDLNLFKLLKGKFLSKSNFHKKGILIFDEISLRESLSVNSKTLTYTGLEDFGGDIQRNEGNEHKANHGFVFMWQSLTEKFTQSIAVFASNGPIKSNNII
jgi:hypothetical protein